MLDRIKWKRDIRYGKSGVKGGGRVGQDKVEEIFDMERVGLKAEDVLDKTKWKRDIR